MYKIHTRSSWVVQGGCTSFVTWFGCFTTFQSAQVVMSAFQLSSLTYFALAHSSSKRCCKMTVELFLILHCTGCKFDQNHSNKWCSNVVITFGWFTLERAGDYALQATKPSVDDTMSCRYHVTPSHLSERPTTRCATRERPVPCWLTDNKINRTWPWPWIKPHALDN